MKKLMLTVVAFVGFFAISNAQDVAEKKVDTKTPEAVEVKKVELIKASDKQVMKAVKVDPTISKAKMNATTNKVDAVLIEDTKKSTTKEEEATEE